MFGTFSLTGNVQSLSKFSHLGVVLDIIRNLLEKFRGAVYFMLSPKFVAVCGDAFVIAGDLRSGAGKNIAVFFNF